MNSFPRPDYVAPDAVPVAWACPIPQIAGNPGNFEFEASAAQLDSHARLISSVLHALPHDVCLAATFKLSTGETRTAYFYGGITFAHAKHIVEMLLV